MSDENATPSKHHAHALQQSVTDASRKGTSRKTKTQTKNWRVRTDINLYTAEEPYDRTWEPSGYFQDDWRATDKLTFNLGLRYDVFTKPNDKNNNPRKISKYAH